MIESGSNVDGIDAAAWRLPLGTALRLERPATPLQPLLPCYAVMDSDRAVYEGPGDWLLPGRAQLWFALDAGPVGVRVRSGRSKPLGIAMLFGPTSAAMPVTSNGGVTIMVEVSPRGWARFFTTPAVEVRDQIVPLDAHWPAAWTAELLKRLHKCDREGAVKGVLDDFFITHLPPIRDQEALVGRIDAHLADDAAHPDVSAWGRDLGIGSQRTLARTCDRYFGFGPKQLQRRRRFLRTLTAMLVAETPPDFGAVPPGYHDVPHFLRDGREFLGMTPRQFLAMPMPYQRAALRARTGVIGAAVAALDSPVAP